MPVKDIGFHDRKTGEILDGSFPVLVGRKVASPYGSEWMQLNQNALAEIAADRDMGAEAFRVFLYLNSRLDFENLILVPQTEIAEALGMKRPSVSRAIKLLVTKEIIIRAPEVRYVGRLSAYRLNPHYGWKGKVKNFPKARTSHLQAVKSSEESADTNPSADR
jgi:hypothetical protein